MIVCEGFNLRMNVSPINDKELLKRTVRKTLSSIAFSTLFVTLPSRAKTYFDTEIYGDKELRVATINKIKQKLRNAIQQDPSIACIFLKLAINDALGYDTTSMEGGLDGSIRFEMNREENANLVNALSTLQEVTQSLQRTTSATFADICAFAGAEALEATGCGRVTAQLGRFDVEAPNTKSQLVPWQKLDNGNLALAAFQSSGLGPKQLVLMLGAIGEMQRIASESIAAAQKQRDELDTDSVEEESMAAEPFVPITFGARDAIYGAKIGKADFGATYLKSVVATGTSGTDDIGRVLLSDPALTALVVKYAQNAQAFKSDVIASYLELARLGESYTTRNS